MFKLPSIYKKLYIYAFVMLVITLVLTLLSLGWIFDYRQKGMIKNALRRQVLFIKREINITERRNPMGLQERINELSEQLGWEIVYWQEGQSWISTLNSPPLLTDEMKYAVKTGGGYHVAWHPPSPPEVLIHMGRPLRIKQRLGSPFPQIQLSQDKFLWLRMKTLQIPRYFIGPAVGALLLLFFLALLLIPYTRFLLRPYRKLESAIQTFSQGQLDHRLDPVDFKDFKELVVAFNHMGEEIKKMLIQKQQLMADVSHELRSPLTRLRMVLEVLGRKYGEEPHLDQGIKNIEELDSIIQDILDLSRLEIDAIPLNKQKIDFTYVLYQSVEAYETLFQEKGFILNLDLPNESMYTWADPEWVPRVIHNLFSNVIKYVPGKTEVDISLKQRGVDLVFILRDRGPGLPENEHQKILTPFYRTDSSRSRRTGGVGLGLSIVKQVLESHKGTIEVRPPTEGPGLELEICLPLFRSEGASVSA